MTYAGIALLILGILIVFGAFLTTIRSMGTTVHLGMGVPFMKRDAEPEKAFGAAEMQHLKGMGVMAIGGMITVVGLVLTLLGLAQTNGLL